VADILERDCDATMVFWMGLVDKDEELTYLPSSVEDRTGHLPKLIHDRITRLRLPKGARNPKSIAAHEHGMLRREQGARLQRWVEESRIFQVSIFHMLNNNLSTVDFSKLLLDVITIADEADSQLKQAALCYVEPKAIQAVA
jgi:hypothetical protein